MPHYNVKPIQLTLRPSYLLAAVLAAAAIGACLIVACMPLALSLKFLVCVPILLVTPYFIAQEALLNLPWSYAGLELNHKGELRLIRKDGTSSAATVLHSSFMAAYLTILNVKLDHSRWRRNLILTPDRVDSGAYRQLRIWLRWGRQVADDVPEEA